MTHSIGHAVLSEEERVERIVISKVSDLFKYFIENKVWPEGTDLRCATMYLATSQWPLALPPGFKVPPEIEHQAACAIAELFGQPKPEPPQLRFRSKALQPTRESVAATSSTPRLSTKQKRGKVSSRKIKKLRRKPPSLVSRAQKQQQVALGLPSMSSSTRKPPTSHQPLPTIIEEDEEVEEVEDVSSSASFISPPPQPSSIISTTSFEMFL